MQGQFKCLGNIADLSFGPECSITRDPWPLFDVKGGGIWFGRNVVISAGVYILTHDHQFNKVEWRNLDEVLPTKPTIIKDYAFLGINTIILPTCKYIGTSSVTGAGSVVTKNIPDYEIWAGNPAVKIGDVRE